MILSLRHAKQMGFSLIELTVVIAILSVIISLSIPSFLTLRIKAARVEASQNMNVIYSLAKAYHADHGTYVTSGSYGFKNLFDRDDSQCDHDPDATERANRFHLSYSLGFRVSTECKKLRYHYHFSGRGGRGNPNFTVGDYTKYFTITAQNYYHKQGEYQSQVGGPPPISPRFCDITFNRDFKPVDTNYVDGMIMTESRMTLPYNNSKVWDALSLCVNK